MGASPNSGKKPAKYPGFDGKPVLIVEDNERISTLIEMLLQEEGFSTITVPSGEEALSICAKVKPCLVILDNILPNMNGLEVCGQMRSKCDVPILMLSVKTTDTDHLKCLSAGADDFLSKPFSLIELRTRVNDILVGPSEGLFRGGEPQWDGFEIDVKQSRVKVYGREIKLTVYESKILRILASSPGQIFSRKELLQGMYSSQDNQIVDRVVDWYVDFLKKKIEKDPAKPEFIIQVPGAGYKFSPVIGSA